MLLIGLLALSGCSKTVVSDVCPEPHLLRCSTVCELQDANISDSALNDMLSVTNVMLKLNAKPDGCECP